MRKPKTTKKPTLLALLKKMGEALQAVNAANAEGRELQKANGHAQQDLFSFVESHAALAPLIEDAHNFAKRKLVAEVVLSHYPKTGRCVQ